MTDPSVRPSREQVLKNAEAWLEHIPWSAPPLAVVEIQMVRDLLDLLSAVPVPAPSEAWEAVQDEIEDIGQHGELDGETLRDHVIVITRAVDRARAAEAETHRQEVQRWKLIAGSFEQDANKHLAALADARQQIAEFQSECEAITDLVGNRAEAGTYAQVDAALADARSQIAALTQERDELRGRIANALL